MEFLTPEQVKIEAEKGEIPALECSWEHHHQGATALYEDLIGALIAEQFDIDSDHCACCQLVGYKFQNKEVCKKCPLYENKACCAGLWNKLDEAMEDFKDDYSESNYKEVQRTESEICTYIERVLERKKAEQAIQKMDDKHCPNCTYKRMWVVDKLCDACKPKESKPALRHGDYGICEYNGQLCGFQYYITVHEKSYFLTPLKEKSYVGIERTVDKIISIDGNISDLALRAEDLEEFEVKTTFQCGVYGGSLKIIKCSTSQNTYNINGDTFVLENLVEIHQKLGQLIATAKRKQKSK